MEGFKMKLDFFKFQEDEEDWGEEEATEEEKPEEEPKEEPVDDAEEMIDLNESS